MLMNCYANTSAVVIKKMASVHQYKKFIRLLQRWPIDTTKTGVDLGQFIRNKVAASFQLGETSTIVHEEKCERMYQSLHRISNDYYAKRYKRYGLSSATGLPAALCREVISMDNLSTLSYEQKGYFSRLKDKFMPLKTKQE